MTPQKILPQVRTFSALGKFVETHFVPAFGHIVRSEIGTGETMKHRGKHPSASCYEIITTRQSNLRLDRRNERSQARLDRLTGWSVSQTACVARYTNFIPWFAITVPVKIAARKLCDFRTGQRRICGKNRNCILFQFGTTQIKSHEILIRLQMKKLNLIRQQVRKLRQRRSCEDFITTCPADLRQNQKLHFVQ